MKKLLLSILSITALNFAVSAQSCTPGANYADSTFGVWPDTIQNLPPGQVNSFYTTDINFKAPSNASDVDPSVPTGTINDFKVNNVIGLPPGFNYACNNANCFYLGGQNGCANVFGTPTQSGTYLIDIEITANVDIGFGVILPYSQTFSGYKIIIGTAGTIEQIIAPIIVSPNPSSNNITVEGISASMKATSISITNIEGRTVATKSLEGNANTSFDVSNLNAGIYFVNVYHASGVEKVKFVKE
jgi:hypothetical protein